MDSYEAYRAARDCAWQVLLETETKSLPVDLESICEREHILLIKYSEVPQSLSFLLEKARQEKNDGISFCFNGQELILYDEGTSIYRQRYTIAHELGHCMMDHFSQSANGTEADWQQKEQQAERFAIQLLAPACVLWGLGIRDSEALQQQCRISAAAAAHRMERLNKLYAREAELQSTGQGSCFLQHPLEKQVFFQFSPYIQACTQK